MAMLAVVAAATAASPSQAGTRVTMRGVYTVVLGDPPTGPRAKVRLPRTSLWLRAHGRLYHLVFHRRPASLAGGTTVLVTGTRSGTTIHVDRIVAVSAPAAAAAAPTGPLSVLVMRASWTGPDDVTEQRVAHVVGEQDSSFYNQDSYGQFSNFVVSATPWLSIADPASPPGFCDISKILSEAEAAAGAAGYTPSAYDREIVYFPDPPAPPTYPDGQCYFASGFGEMPGRVTWIRGSYMEPGVTAHELGHNFGLGHANLLRCTDAAGNAVPFSSTCVQVPYYDSWSTMGSSLNSSGTATGPDGRHGGLFNAIENEDLGWMQAGGRELFVTSAQTVRLVPYESQGSGIHAVAIADGGGGFNYYLEYRQPTGWDDLTLLTPGLLMHRRLGSASAPTGLMDMSPALPGVDPTSHWNSGFAVGQSYTGPNPGDPTITLEAADASGATVRIEYAPATPTAPAVSFDKTPYQIGAGSPTTVAVAIHWTAGTGAAICRYQLQRSVNGGVWTAVSLPAPLATSVGQTVALGSAYRYRVRAVGCTGATSAWSLGAFAASGSQQGAATYTGSWSLQSASAAWGGGVKTTTAAGASATFTCICRNVAWVATMGPGYGQAKVYVDGSLTGQTDTRRATVSRRMLVFRFGWSAAASHSIRIVNVRTANRPRIDVDGFVVLR